MADGRGNGQEKARSGRQRGGKATGGDQRDHPARKLGDLGVGKHHDVVVHGGQFVADDTLFGKRFAPDAIGRIGQGGINSSLLFDDGRFQRCLVGIGGSIGQGLLRIRQRLVGVGNRLLFVEVLDHAVAVLVSERQQAGLLPVPDPGQFRVAVDFGNRQRRLREGLAVNRTRPEGGGDVQTRHRPDRRGDRVKQCDEHQRPASRRTGVRNLGHSEEADDDVRQTRRTDHQRHGDQEHVEHVRGVGSVGGKAKVSHHLVKLVQEVGLATRRGIAADQAKLWHDVAGQAKRDEQRRDRVGDDQHDVLRHLGIGDALHAAEHGIGEHHRRTDQQAGRGRHFQEACKGHAHANHLPDDVSDRDDEKADHSHHAGTGRIEPVAHEFRHSELAELAQVRRQKQRKQHIAAGPTHQEDRVVVAAEGDKTRHRDEGSCRHPVSRRRHAVDHRANALTRRVEFSGRACTGPERDAEIQRERQADDDKVKGKLIHLVLPPYSSTP